MKNILIIFFISSILFAQYEDTEKRGGYYFKKDYSGGSIPTFLENKNKIPSPILEDNKDYVDLYWRAWELAFDHFKKPPEGSPFVSNFIDEAFSPSVFQWDTIFMIMFSRYAHHIFPSIESLDNFYCRQYESGYICREIWEANGEDYVYEGREHTVNPPLFGWAEIETYKLTNDKSRFKNILPVLEKYAEWLEKFRKKENTKHNLYWQTGLGSGMDNTPRTGSAWICMSAQMCMFYKNLSFISSEIGENEKAEMYLQKSNEIAWKINQLMWNDEDGLYYDLDDDGNQIKVKTIASFWPMLAGIADYPKAEKMLNNLKDSKTFWRTVPFPSLSADHKEYAPDGKYWLGGVWAPTNVMVIKGLDKFAQGYDHSFYYREFAKLASEIYLDGMYETFRKTGTIWENYSPEAKWRGVWAQPNFVGWSGCGPIMLLIENVLGIQADASKNEITWYLNRIDKHGIENLRFGETTASLISERRISVDKSCEISVTANKPFKLIIYNWMKPAQTFDIEEGTNKLMIN